MMQGVEQAIQTSRRLKALGIQLAMDDFGTRYSSLSYLKRFPIDRLKIDGSFVANITSDSRDTAVVLAVVAMAHNLNLQVIAEGVETEAQRVFLKEHDCDEIQEVLISRAAPSRIWKADQGLRAPA
jgi:EAL domain-containing protein (putative c-di-GMP-specific phosphodiesterase class I)